jgi:hypothetical protein
VALFSAAAAWPVLAGFLARHTDTDVPYWDAFPTAASVLGQFLLGRKFVENWPTWLVVNTVSVGLFAYKGLVADGRAVRVLRGDVGGPDGAPGIARAGSLKMKLDAERGRDSWLLLPLAGEGGMRVPRAAPTLTPALSRPAGEGALRFMLVGTREARWSN